MPKQLLSACNLRVNLSSVRPDGHFAALSKLMDSSYSFSFHMCTAFHHRFHSQLTYVMHIKLLYMYIAISRPPAFTHDSRATSLCFAPSLKVHNIVRGSEMCRNGVTTFLKSLFIVSLISTIQQGFLVCSCAQIVQL